MKIIYHCFGGSHSSVTSAALHLGWLPANRLPTPEEFMAVPFFDKTGPNDFGLVRIMGVDRKGHEVYVLAKKNLGNRLNNVFLGLADLMGIKDNLVVVNTLPYVNWMMMLGGFLSRRIGLPTLGRPILFWGTRKAYFELVGLVETIKIKLL